MIKEMNISCKVEDKSFGMFHSVLADGTYNGKEYQLMLSIKNTRLILKHGDNTVEISMRELLDEMIASLPKDKP